MTKRIVPPPVDAYEVSAYTICDRDEAETLAEQLLAHPAVVAVGVRPVDEDDPRFAEAVA